MTVLGLTGSFGSGKSVVARMFAALGGVIVDADEIAKEVVKSGSPAFQEIVQAFGHEVVSKDGELDRKKLATLVFQDASKRERLNKIVHPRVRKRELELLSRYEHHPLVVLSVALLFENKMEHLVDKIVVVVVNEAERMRRLTEKKGLTPEEIQRRLQAQMPQEEKRKRADFVIDNSGSLDETQAQVKELAAMFMGETR
jgi:dephospho-CoA kinase